MTRIKAGELLSLIMSDVGRRLCPPNVVRIAKPEEIFKRQMVAWP